MRLPFELEHVEAEANAHESLVLLLGAADLSGRDNR
jgi:hypothetical protein